MLYVYAIARVGLATDGLVTGLEERPVEAVEESGLALLATRHDEIALEPTPAFAWAHQNVVERLAELGDVLPMRIATTLPGDGDARALLRSRAQEFRVALDRVGGAIEFGVRAVLDGAEERAAVPEPALAGEGPGTTYMRERLASRRVDEALREAVLEPLRPYARASSLRPGGRAGGPASLSVAYLVDRDGAGAFIERVAELDEELDTTRVLCTGPWPPYSFVDPTETP